MAAHLYQAKRAPRAAFPSACLATQTKRWAEGIRVPAPLAGGGTQILYPLTRGLSLWSTALLCYREGGTLLGGGLTEGGVFPHPLPSEDFGNSFHALIPWPRGARGAGTLIPSAQRLVWVAKQALGKAALGPGLHARYTDWLSVCLPYAGRRG